MQPVWTKRSPHLPEVQNLVTLNRHGFCSGDQSGRRRTMSTSTEQNTRYCNLIFREHFIE